MSARNLTYCPASSVAAPPAATYYLFPVTYSLIHSFSAKERDAETGLSYFGSRYYSSDLSVWLSVDPMSGKYPSLSPYVYCANNPVKLVDPNGEEIEITETTDNAGNRVINMNFTARIVNKSSHNYTKKEMSQLRDEISSSIKEKYSGEFGNGVIVNTIVDITCNDEKSEDLWAEINRHTINIVDNCSDKTWAGEAPEGGSYMNLKWNLGHTINLNAQTDVWKFSKPYKKNHTVLIIGNMSAADTITLRIGGATLIDNLTISHNDTVNCKGYYESYPLYYAFDADSISHFFGIDINGKYQIDYLIWFRNPHKIKKICNALDSSEKYLDFTRNGDLGSYAVEVILNGNRYTSIGHWDKRFCYLYIFTENGQRTVKITHDSRFRGLM